MIYFIYRNQIDVLNRQLFKIVEKISSVLDYYVLSIKFIFIFTLSSYKLH